MQDANNNSSAQTTEAERHGVANVSVRELENELKSRYRSLQELQQTRDRIFRRIEEIEKDIAVRTACPTPESVEKDLLELSESRDKHKLRQAILNAEDSQFTPEQNRRLAPRLLSLANRLRNSNDPDDRPIVYAAIRTGAFMLHPEECHLLHPLMDSNYPIETSGVTVKMIGRIFEAQPPAGVDRYPETATDLIDFLKPFMNRHVLTIPQNAAMGQLTIYALAAAASNHALDAIRRVNQLGIAWFKRRTSRNLRELQDRWQEQSAQIATDHRALIERTLAELQCPTP